VSGLRFCFLTTFYPPYNFGGDGIGIQRLARGLVRAGHHVTVVHDVDAYRFLAPKSTPSAGPEPAGLEVVPLRSGLGPLSLLLTQQLGKPIINGKRIARVLEQGRFDVINFHNLSLIGGPGLLRYGQGIKLYMAHEHWLVCPTHVLWRHGRELCTGRQCVRCQLSYRRPPQVWRATGFLERELVHVDTFIAMSEFSRAKHKEFGFPREMEVLPYFLPEAEQEAPATPALRPQERPYFLFVGRLERIKGLQDVIPAFAGPGDYDLLIAGDGEFGAELRRMGQGVERVRFLGRLGSADLARHYAHATALIVPSICYETFGIILIEAFRQSLPVIARRLGPFPEIVQKSGGGETFSTREELIAAMHRMTTDPGRRQAMGNSARVAFEEYWSEQVVVPRYLEIVRQAAERKGLGKVLATLSPGSDP
jgi:glycosyltransferase involved in cell wall biosynthesis